MPTKRLTERELKARLAQLRKRAAVAAAEESAGIDPLDRAFLNEPGPIDGDRGGGASKGQRRYLEDPHKNRFLRCANKVGKTQIMCTEDWSFMTGRNPFRDDVPFPCTILWICPDLGVSWSDDVSVCFRQAEPAGVLHRDCRYDEAAGYTIPASGGRRPGIMTKPVWSCCGHGKFVPEDHKGEVCPHCGEWTATGSGSRVIVRSGEQDGAALAGIKADKVSVNEPPRQDRWGETVRAAANTNAPISAAMTPVSNHGVSRDLQWLREEVEGDPARGIEPKWQLGADGNPMTDTAGAPIPLWSVTVIWLTPDNVPWRTPESVAAQIANCPPAEHEIRINGGWETLASDRVLTNYDESVVFDGAELPGFSGGEVKLGLCADHGELPGHEAWLLYAWRGVGESAVVWVLDEYASPARTTEKQDAMGVIDMLERHGWGVHHIDDWVGDVNTAGKSRLGNVNKLFEQAITEIVTGHPTPEIIRIASAVKGQGSVMYGARVLNAALGHGRMYVHRRCTRFRQACRRWAGGNDGYKHWIDAGRYGLEKKLDPRAKSRQLLVNR